MDKEWAKKFSKRYTLSFEDIRYMIKFAKQKSADSIN